MKILFIKYMWVLFILTVFPACHNKVNVTLLDNTEELRLVTESINNVIGWAVTKDFELLFSSIFHSPVYKNI